LREWVKDDRRSFLLNFNENMNQSLYKCRMRLENDRELWVCGTLYREFHGLFTGKIPIFLWEERERKVRRI
jgi:hypothetical protein